MIWRSNGDILKENLDSLIMFPEWKGSQNKLRLFFVHTYPEFGYLLMSDALKV